MVISELRSMLNYNINKIAASWTLVPILVYSHCPATIWWRFDLSQKRFVSRSRLDFSLDSTLVVYAIAC